MADDVTEVPTTHAAAIEVVSDETRTFPPPAAFKKDALVVDTSLYDEAARDYQGFWARQAAELVDMGQGLGHHLRVGAAVRQVVHRR